MEIEYMGQIAYAVGSLMLKSNVAMHKCATAYVIKH